MKAARRPINITIVLISVALMLSSCARDPQKAKVKYLAAGQKYMKKGQYGDAIIEFRNAVRLDPRDGDAYYQLAQANAAEHAWPAAYASLEKVIEMNPNRLDARLDRGRLYLSQREFDEAQDDANFILKQNPKDVGAYQLLGAALIGQGKPDQALAIFLKVAELSPNDGSNYLNLALAEITLHLVQESEQHFKKAVQLSPKSVQASLDLANFYHLQDRLPDAEQALQTGIQNNPDAPELYIDWAGMLSSRGKQTEAESVLERLRVQMPRSTDASIAMGDYYLTKRDTGKAVAEYRRGLSLSSKNLELEERLEDVYVVSSQTEEAAEIDARLMKQAPKDVLVRVNHGRLLMAQGKPQDAENQLMEVVKDVADSAQAHYYLALSLQQKGSLGQANSELQQALRLSPGSPLVLQSLAKLNLAQGNASVAQNYAAEFVQKFPTDANARLLLGEAYLQEAQVRAAEEQFSAANQLAPDQAEVHSNLGRLYWAQKKLIDAEKEFETAGQLDPSNVNVLTQYAGFLAALQESPKAIAQVRQFVNANPTNIQGHMTLGELRFTAKDAVGARAEFERALQLDPKNIQAYLQMGRTYEAENQTDLAIGQYQKALELQPKSAPLCTKIGNLYLHRGDLEGARRYFQKALDADPGFAVAMANIAWIDALQGTNLNVALGMAQKAKSLMPDLPSITDTLAWILYMKGNYDGAIPLLQECVQKSPNSAEFRYHLGMTLLATGQKVKGREELEAALRMKLDSAEAQQAQKTLAQSN